MFTKEKIEIGKPENQGPPFAEVHKIPPIPIYTRPDTITELTEEMTKDLD